ETAHENRTAAVAVAEASPPGRGEQLAQRVTPQHRRDELRSGAEAIRHVRNEWDQDAEPERVDDAEGEERCELSRQPGAIRRSLVPGHERRDLRTGLRGRRQCIARGVNDEVWQTVVVPVRIARA